MRRVLACLVALAAPVAASAEGAASAAPLRLGTGAVHAIAVSGDRAFVVVDSGRGDHPFALVRSSGGAVTPLGAFGAKDTEFPDVAADSTGRAVASWKRPVSAGLAIF